MATVLMEGFRVVPDGSGYTTLGAATGGTTTWERTASRTGWGIQQRNTSSSDNSGYSAVLTATPYSQFANPGFSLGFATKHAATAGAVNFYCQIVATGGGAPFAFTARTGSPVGFYSLDSGLSAGEVLDMSPITSGWHWWCLTGNMNQTAGGWYRVYRDGTLVARIEGDTYAYTMSSRGNLMRAQVSLPSINSISGVALSDFILNDDTNVIVESRVDVLLPRTTVQAGWTPTSGLNHECIDDEPSVNTADYVSTSTVGATDLYRFDPLPHNPTSIYAVQFQAIASKSDTGARSMAPLINGVEGTARDPGPGLSIPQLVSTNPATGLAWTKTDVDLVQAGVRLIS